MSEPNLPMEITGSRGQQVSRKFLGYLASGFVSLLSSLLSLWGRGVCVQWDLSLGELCPSWSIFGEPKREIEQCVLVLEVLPTSHLPSFITAS